MFQASNIFTLSVCGISLLVLELVLTSQFVNIQYDTHPFTKKDFL